MAGLITTDFTLPVDVSDGIWKKAQSESTIARLSGARPQKFGKTNVMVLNSAPKAELVGESVEKSPTPTGYGNKTVIPLKLQVTMRTSNEVQFADEDYQLGILNDMMENAGIALGRALDIVGYHKINPLTGTVSANVPEGIADTASAATLAGTAYDAAVEAAAGLIIENGYTPSGIALDPVLAYGLATQRDNDNRKLYPELGFGLNVTNFDGMTAAVGDTVSAKKEAAAATGILGFVGQFDAFRWGVQRDIGAHLIEFGDPDGLGDLQRKNEVAIRAEILYGIGIMDLAAFAKIVSV